MRPKATPDFDQGYVTPETTVLRLALMAQQGDLVGRDLLLLGDDDLTGIAAALSGLPRRICILDVDERIVSFIRDVARDRGWDHVHAEVYDVRDGLPSHLRGQFDVFFTDPVETVNGLLLFLSRCTEGLRGPGAAGYFGLSYLEASWRKWREIQRGILDMCFAITDMLGAFQDLLEDIVARGYPVAHMHQCRSRGPKFLSTSAPSIVWSWSRSRGLSSPAGWSLGKTSTTTKKPASPCKNSRLVTPQADSKACEFPVDIR
jgi:predicted methyltransferase